MEEQIQARMREILQIQIGDLVWTCARLRAEKEVRQAAEAASGSGSPNGAQGADGSGTKVGE